MPEDLKTELAKERYKRVLFQQNYFADRASDSFKLFVQITIVTIGGFIWLKMQPNAKSVEHLFPLARWIIPIIAIFTILQILSDHASWRGYRKAEAEILNRDDLKPGLKSGRLELFRALVVAFVGLGGWLYLK